MIDRDHVLRVLAECGGRIKGPVGAALRLGITPPTLHYHLKRLGIERPPRPARAPAAAKQPIAARPAVAAVHHIPAAPLLLQLQALRTRARRSLATCPAGPARIELLRAIEVEHKQLLVQLRSVLGETLPQHGLARGPCAPGAMRPAWELASTFCW